MNLSSYNNSSNATLDSQEVSKEVLQRQHYFLFEQLQSMVKQVPIHLQQRLSNELLSGLSGSLLDGTVYQIVNNLSELQQLTERNLYSERNRISTEYTNQRSQLIKRHKATEQACETRPHHMSIVQAANKRELDAFEKRMNDELHRFDLKIINEIDQKVLEQQETMSQAGVYGFQQSTQPNDIKLQMCLFQLIQRLSQLKMPH